MPERPRKKFFSVKILSGRAVLWHREMDGWIDEWIVSQTHDAILIPLTSIDWLKLVHVYC